MRQSTFAIAALALVILSGCNQRQKVEASDSARRAGEQAKSAASNAQKSLSDASVTFKIKTAMSASDKLNTSGINIDTKDRVVYLRGTAADAQQKALAERIARDTAGDDIRVISELGVRAGAHPREIR